MPVNIVGGTSNSSGLTSKDVLEISDKRYVNEQGDVMKGNLDLGGNKIINVGGGDVLTMKKFEGILRKKMQLYTLDSRRKIY